jgi:hypothetical protein
MTLPANPIRRSVLTEGVERWWECGWSYVMPDFNKPNHSIIEWVSGGAPVEPNRAPTNQQTEERHGRPAGR